MTIAHFKNTYRQLLELRQKLSNNPHKGFTNDNLRLMMLENDLRLMLILDEKYITYER